MSGGYIDFLAHDPDNGSEGTDILITIWADTGTCQVAVRPGRDCTGLTWRPAPAMTWAPMGGAA